MYRPEHVEHKLLPFSQHQHKPQEAFNMHKMQAYSVKFPGVGPIVVMSSGKLAAHKAALTEHRIIMGNGTFSPIGVVTVHNFKVGDKFITKKATVNV